jgi:hypothetical protein
VVVGEKRELDDTLKPEHRPMLAKTKAWWAAGYVWGCRSAPAPGVEASAVNRRISVGRSKEGGARAAVSCQEFTHDPFFPDHDPFFPDSFGCLYLPAIAPCCPIVHSTFFTESAFFMTMVNWSERFSGAPATALCFVNELKIARLGALADAEGWMPLVLAFERLGKFLVNDRKANLGRARNEIISLGRDGLARCQEGIWGNIPVEILVNLVVDGRNEEFHGGSAARRFTSHCLELGILLEDGLKFFLAPMKLKYVMTPNPACAELDLPLYCARRLMLENSFTWLPVKHDASWFGISDHAIVSYANQCAPHYGKTIRAAIEGPAESRLALVDLKTFDGETEIDAVISALKNCPVLVSGNVSDHVIGIVTAFDLL